MNEKKIAEKQNLARSDPEIFELIKLEEKRQEEVLRLIPSENYASQAVRQAVGSILMNKYAEGYPQKRYYQGEKYIDKIEALACKRARKLFKVPAANVQPYSGSLANLAVYLALCQPGDTVMGMSLPHGGHLTHGWKVNISGKWFKSVQYQVDKKTGLIDYEGVAKLAQKHKPKIIWAGATAYPRFFNWKKLAEIADAVGAYFCADIAHLAGLIVAGVHPNPAPFAHLITTTTHKSLRGPRGAMVMVTKRGLRKDSRLAQKIDQAVFPGLQGGPHQQTIAGIAVALKEAATSEFKRYGWQIMKNAKILAKALKTQSFNLITGGTDNHLILIDLGNKGISGQEAAEKLEEAGIIVNKNAIPFDPCPPMSPSGIRLGTPAITAKGMKEKEMKLIAEWIEAVISGQPTAEIRKKVTLLCRKFPLP